MTLTRNCDDSLKTDQKAALTLPPCTRNDAIPFPRMASFLLLTFHALLLTERATGSTRMASMLLVRIRMLCCLRHLALSRKQSYACIWAAIANNVFKTLGREMKEKQHVHIKNLHYAKKCARCLKTQSRFTLLLRQASLKFLRWSLSASD
jgi:hypothetical protein